MVFYNISREKSREHILLKCDFEQKNNNHKIEDLFWQLPIRLFHLKLFGTCQFIFLVCFMIFVIYIYTHIPFPLIWC